MPQVPQWLKDLGNTDNGVFAVDENQRILTWNHGAETLLGHTPNEAIGRPCHEVVRGRLGSGQRFCSTDCKIQQFSRRGTRFKDFDLLATTTAQERLWLTVSSTSLESRGRPIVLHVVRRSERRTQSEQALDDILSTLNAYGLTGHSPNGEESTDGAAPQASNILSTLTGRELEVLGLLTRDCSTEDIARKLDLSVLTVRCHIRNMMKKTDRHSRTELVAAAVRSGMSR